HYQSVLDQVSFSSSAADITGGGAHPTRTVTWQINDGAATNNLSAPQTTTVNMAGKGFTINMIADSSVASAPAGFTAAVAAAANMLQQTFSDNITINIG